MERSVIHVSPADVAVWERVNRSVAHPPRHMDEERNRRRERSPHMAYEERNYRRRSRKELTPLDTTHHLARTKHRD